MKVENGWVSEYLNPEYWDTRTSLYLGLPALFRLYQDLNDKKLRMFLRKLNGKILDAGCGDGRFMAYADVGVDFSKGMIKRAKHRYHNRHFVCASILYLPFKDKAFSNAFTVDVLSHIHPKRREEAVNELSRVAVNSYNFLAEHRTVTATLLEILQTTRSKLLRFIFSYVIVFLAFPFDRIKKLEIDKPNQVIKKLAYPKIWANGRGAI